MPREDIPLFYPKEDLHLLCGKCKGLSGGCPPYAPYFDSIKPSMPWFYVVIVRFDMAWAIKYAGKSDYFRSGYADRVTVMYLIRILRNVARRIPSYPLLAGGCLGCSTRQGECAVLSGSPCIQPQSRFYSVEATGVDCSALHKIFFGQRLPYWYYDGAIPRYMYRYAGLFVNKPDGLYELLNHVTTNDASYIPSFHAIPPQYPLTIRIAPDHVVDAGMEYEAYDTTDSS